MGEKTKRETITATFEKDSKRYRRFLIDENDEGIVGTIYVPKGKDAPESVTLSFKEE